MNKDKTVLPDNRPEEPSWKLPGKRNVSSEPSKSEGHLINQTPIAHDGHGPREEHKLKEAFPETAEETVKDKNIYSGQNEISQKDFDRPAEESSKDWRRSLKDDGDDEDNMADKAKRAIKKAKTTLKKAKKSIKKKVKKSK